MAVSAKVDVAAQSLVISIIGRFDFNSHNDFRLAYEGVSPIPETILIDMKQASFIDSSALGMLLILRDYAGGNEANIEITDCNDEVRSILEVANFDDLFPIS